MIEIKSIPISRQEELEKLLHKTIEERKHLIMDKLNESNIKEPLISKIRIVSSSTSFISAIPIANNSEWLTEFLKTICIDCCNLLYD